MSEPPAHIESAFTWIEPYWNAEHLRRTYDWLLELDAEAPEALRLAALTHDIERHFPGGPTFDPGTMTPEDEEYRQAHSERSARIVGAWLRERDASPELVAKAHDLIVLHEIGGTPDADLLQAADSLSFLEVNADLVRSWVDEGRCSGTRARQQLDRMLDRIQVEAARPQARSLHAAAVARVGEP